MMSPPHVFQVQFHLEYAVCQIWIQAQERHWQFGWGPEIGTAVIKGLGAWHLSGGSKNWIFTAGLSAGLHGLVTLGPVAASLSYPWCDRFLRDEKKAVSEVPECLGKVPTCLLPVKELLPASLVCYALQLQVAPRGQHIESSLSTSWEIWYPRPLQDARCAWEGFC